MVGIIIVSHGPYAKALIKSVELVCGKQEKIEAICLGEGEGVEYLQHNIMETIKKLNVEEVLIMVDLLGGTPYNASSMVMENLNINVVTGINMSMILEVLPYRNEGLVKVSQIAIEGGINGIINVKERFEGVNKSRDINVKSWKDEYNAKSSKIRW